ncbi:MAG: CPBP family intramembrane metalloprotease [Balneolaceae bacterium]|nr:CPBP family intramembrane metalloprotease [Balneolaceae bacterium]
MRKEYIYALLVTLLTVGFIWLALPLGEFLNNYNLNQKENELLARTIVRTLIFVALILSIKKLGLSSFNGIGKHFQIKEPAILSIPLFLIVVGFWANWSIYSEADLMVLILFVLSVLSVGLVEELSMRGLVLPFLISGIKKKRFKLYAGVIFSSLIFGLIHYITIFSQPENIWGISSQVIFGISIGIFFGALMLRVRNIYILAVCHGCVNFILGNGILRKGFNNRSIADYPKAAEIDPASTIATIAIFGIIAFIGLNMIRKVDVNEVLSELESLKV